jgi:hypothetical protein
MGLRFGPANEAAREAIEAAVLPPAAKAGLWLLHDFFEESHTISQDLHTPEGSYWHAILHRREGDFSNAKYWFRKVGSHPVFEALKTEAFTLGYAYTMPFEFVDFCSKAIRTGGNDEQLAVNVQMAEWHLLFEYCTPGLSLR